MAQKLIRSARPRLDPSHIGILSSPPFLHVVILQFPHLLIFPFCRCVTAPNSPNRSPHNHLCCMDHELGTYAIEIFFPPHSTKHSIAAKARFISREYPGWSRKEQEQTKFYDLRRGITEDFQRLANFQRTLSKSNKKSLIFERFCVFDLF